MNQHVATYRLSRGIAAGLIGLCVLTSSVSPAWPESMRLRLALPTSPASYMLPMYVAKDQGWLSKAGLEIEENYLVGDAAVVRAILSGNADIGAPGVFAVYPAIAEGGKIKAFGSWQPTTDYWIIAHKKFKAVEDLKNASIASFGPTGLSMEIPRLVLKTRGVDTSRVNFVSVGGMSDRLKAVLAGKVDATMIDTLFATKGLENPDLHIIASIAKEFPQIAYIYLVGAEKILREKRKEVELFTRYAIVLGSRLIVKNPDVAVTALHKRLPDLDPQFIRSIVDRLVETGVFGTDGGLDRKVTEFTVNLGLETGTLKKRVTFDEVADSSFVEKVLAEEGRYRK